jgi:hypothetical protein
VEAAHLVNWFAQRKSGSSSFTRGLLNGIKIFRNLSLLIACWESRRSQNFMKQMTHDTRTTITALLTSIATTGRNKERSRWP